MKKCVLTAAVMLLPLLMSFAKGSQDVAAKNETPHALVVWSGAAEDEAQALVDAFSKQHPEIEVSVIRAGSGELMTRLNAEQPKPSGDILLGLAKESFDSAYDLFKPYKTVHHADITKTVRDSAETPRYYGFSMPLQAIMVNTNMLKPEEYPKTWKDLADPKYKGEVILANPALSGSAYAQLYMWSKLYGDDFLKKIAKNVTFVANSHAGPEGVARGEYAITATGESNIAKYIGKGDPITYVYPKDGTGARFDASGIIANGPNPKAAELFMDFLTSKEAYNIILTTRGRRVVIPDLPGPKYLPSMNEITLIDYDAVEAGKIHDELCDRFSEMMQ